MSDTSTIKRRIQAVTETAKITGAMELVSSSRMRRVMSHLDYNRRYFRFIRNAMREILESESDEEESAKHKYLRQKENPRRVYAVISSDKGLCGSYNAEIFSLTQEKLDEHPDSMLVTIGLEAERHFIKSGHSPDHALYGLVQDPTMKSARHIARELLKLFDDSNVDEVNVIYMAFYGSLKCKPICQRIIPIMPEDYMDSFAKDEETAETVTDTDGTIINVRYDHDMEYLPSRLEVFENIVPQYIIGLLFGVMVQAYAAEHYFRMNAMQSSTDNAKEMLDELKLQYNLARQSAITNEITEITGAAEVINAG